MYCLLKLALVAARVDMVCMSPVVELERFVIESSAPFPFEFPLLMLPWRCLPGIPLFLMYIGILGGLDEQ